MPLVIEKKEIKNWLKELKKGFAVFDVRKSVLPPKQYFFPPKEETFNFDLKSQKLSVPDYEGRVLLFGLNMAHLEAMTQLDEIMEKPLKDFYYWRRREKSVLVGLTDNTVIVPMGGDIILEKINSKQYQVLVLTEKGKKAIKSKLIKKIAKPVIKKYSTDSNPMKEMLLDSELLAEAVAWSANHKIWDELAKKCLGCGICTYVCPLCHCFSIEDRVNLDGESCSRCRQWDACTLPNFSKIAGGHKFHPTVKERYYNWFYHKFVRAYKEYGKSQCVACGNCKNNCPAGIGIAGVLMEIVKDYEKYLRTRKS